MAEPDLVGVPVVTLVGTPAALGYSLPIARRLHLWERAGMVTAIVEESRLAVQEERRWEA